MASHDRITRTAELVGIKLPKGRSRNRYSRHESSSDSSSFFDSDSSDSDGSSVQSLKESEKAQVKAPTAEHIFPPTPMRGGPPPPPPANWPPAIPMASRPTPPWAVPSCVLPSPPAEAPAGIAVNSVGHDLKFNAHR